MQYTPYTEAEIKSMNIMEEGIYDFKVIEVITQEHYNVPLRDKNGNEMAKVKLLIIDNNPFERTLFTYISGDKRFAYKLRHFAQTLGMISQYDGGTFRIEDSLGKTGKANIVVKRGTLKNDGSGEVWPDRNDVKDFVIEANTLQSPVVDNPISDNLDQNDVPF